MKSKQNTILKDIIINRSVSLSLTTFVCLSVLLYSMMMMVILSDGNDVGLSSLNDSQSPVIRHIPLMFYPNSENKLNQLIKKQKKSLRKRTKCKC